MSDIFLKNKKGKNNLSDLLDTESIKTPTSFPQWLSIVDQNGGNDELLEGGSTMDSTSGDAVSGEGDVEQPRTEFACPTCRAPFDPDQIEQQPPWPFVYVLYVSHMAESFLHGAPSGSLPRASQARRSMYTTLARPTHERSRCQCFTPCAQQLPPLPAPEHSSTPPLG